MTPDGEDGDMGSDDGPSEVATGGRERGGDAPLGNDEVAPLLDERGLPALERPMFAHPQWTVGVVLVIAVVMLLLGILGHPVWLLIGSPFILTLAIWVAVRIVEGSRRRGNSDG